MATTKNQTKNTSGPRFAKYEDIRNVLHAQTEAAVTEGLTALRNQLTIKHSEDVISAGDERLLLAKTWLERDNAARGLFDLWGTVNTRQVSLIALIVSVLSSLITLLSSHYTYHHLAAPVIRDILLPQWSNKLNTYLSTSHNELLLVTLKLYNSISTFAGGKESRNVLDTFPWELKTLPKLLNMRRRSKTNDYVDALVKPDIRTLYVLFLLSFVDSRTPTIVKAAFLEQRRDNFTSIFKGLSQDGYSVVRKVLETCWSGVWADVKIKRTVKVNIFNEHIIGQITRLYERTAAEEEGSESVPADLVHHFLLAICSRPGTGVCFRDQGWYPREDENEIDTLDHSEDAPRRYQGRVHNKILANVLKPLRVNEDARQQELALRILQACPELVAGYWPAVALTLEPRLSSKWIANIAFFGSVVSLPVPQSSFLLPDDSKLYRPSPPSLSTIMENILPSVNIKSHLSRGLQSPSALVQHCTALALGKCLTKYGAVLKSMREVQQALEEDEGNGLWSIRRSEVERELLRRVPDFQVVVAFAQQKPAQVPMAVDGEVQDTTVSTKAALLSESAQRLLWLYHRYLPQLVAEARFDATRLLAGIHEGISDSDATVGLVTLRQLHTLRLLNESEEFSIMGKAGTTRGALNALFTLYTETNTKPIKLAVATLLKRSLSQTLLFQHDPHEVDLWLRSIPRSKRAPDAQAPDGTLLSDEVTAVISFLEDCIQRCAKTPYRYLEDLQLFWSQNSSPSLEDDTRDSSTFPSPLLITVLEQLEAKFTRNLLSPSDCLATVTYIRKLALRLAGKVQVLQPLHSLAKRLGALVDKPGPSSVMAAINREAQYLSAGLKQLEFPTSVSDEHNTAADAFLKEVQAEHIPSSTSARYIRAYQLVDWYRLSVGSLNPVQFTALASVIDTLAPAAVEDLLDYATFGGGHVWHYVNIATQPKQLDFGILFLHCDNDFVSAQTNRHILVCSAFSDHPSAEDLKRAVGIVHHRLSYTTGAFAIEGLIHILMELLQRAFSENVREATEIAHILWRLPTIASYTRKALDPVVLPVFRDLMIYSKRATTADENLLEDHIEFWSAKLMLDVSRLSDIEIETAIMWLQVMDHTRLLSLLDQFHFSTVTHEENSTTILAGILSALSKHLEVNYELPGLASRLPQLRDAASILQNSESAKRILATAVKASLPLSYDGVVAESNSNKSLSSSVKIASEHWRAALDRTAGQVDVERLVQQDNLTADDMTILAAAVYKSGSARAVIRYWLSAPNTANISAHDVAPVLHAYLDASLSNGDNIGEEDAFLCARYVRAVLHVEDKIICQESSHIFNALLSLLPRLPPSMTEQIIASMSDSKAGPSAQVLSVLPSLPSSISDATRKSIGKLLARASKWIITTLSSDGPLSSRAHDAISATARTIKHFKSLSSSSAETLVISAVQYRLQEPSALSMVVGVLGSIDLKPATVNKILQSILQHPKFEALGRVGENRQPEVRSKLVTVLHTLFYLHPKNTCQPSHVQPLLALYGGTMSEIDRKILSIFKLFEVTRNASVASLLIRWSATVDPPSTTSLEAVQSFDATRMLRTCLQFPQRINTGEEVSSTAGGEDIYDPWLVILLCSRMLSEGVPTTAPGWVQLFRTNVVGLLIRASSSHDDEVRNAAILQLNGLYTVLQDADFQEKPHVIYILDLLKDTYSKNTPADHAPRLPVYITLHLVHALRGIFYPSNFTYPLTARFLLQRPELDTNDMPLLYSMLYSVSDQWRKERAWIVRFMSDGMVGRQEWKVLRKRHVWDLLASMFHSEESDLQLRRSILELLANLTCERHAATSLVLGSALLSWIELQMERIRHGEGLAWVKILENILVVVDTSKMEASTSGKWRSSICRCLAALLQNPACGRSIFVYAVRVIQRISGLPTVSGAQLDSLVRFGVKHLASLEDVLQAPIALSDPLEPPESIWAIAPHRSYGLWRSIEADELELWGQCVESLWSVIMRLEEKTPEWDALTARLLIWRAYAGQRCTVGEWARTEVIRNIRVD